MSGAHKLVTTSKAAAELGIHPATLWRWQQAGIVAPAYTTPGGQARWDVNALRNQLGAERGDRVPDPATTPEPPPTVAAIVTSKHGVLIGRRNDGKPLWTFIAGKIRPGESPTDAAEREVKEETGLVVQAAEREIGRRVHPITGRTMIYLACRPTGKLDVFVGDEEELAEVKWASLDEALTVLTGLYEPVRAYLIAKVEE